MGLFSPGKKEKQLLSEIEQLKQSLLPEQQDILSLKLECNELEERKRKTKHALESLEKKFAKTQKEMLENKAITSELKKQIINLKEDISFQSFGIYEPSFAFADSDFYKGKLKECRSNQKALIKKNMACVGNQNWIVDGSQKKGLSMLKDMKQLLLRTFNIECDDIIANVKLSNFDLSKDRIYKIAKQISQLANHMKISITETYIDLKIEELILAFDFTRAKQDEKDKLKELKEQQREEARAQKEIEEERKKLKKEQAHYQNALEKIVSQIATLGETKELLSKKLELETQIEDTGKAIANVDYREANKRAGYVYVISNIGAFGENVYKIGMTRRLEPTDRVNELGDASVPFNFDIHALIFSDDAPGLESALHNAFATKKLNQVNQRREFFKVSLAEIKEEVRKNHDKTVEWSDYPEAEQYRQSNIYEKVTL